MFLKEFEGRSLFEKYHIPVARGVLVRQDDDISAKVLPFLESEADTNDFVLKAQLLSGKRGKSGGILFVGRDNIIDSIHSFFGARVRGEVVREVLVQKKLSIYKELYLSVTIDRFLRCPVIVFSAEGGVEIEEIAKSAPDKVFEIPLPVGPFDHKDFDSFYQLLREKVSFDDALAKKITGVAEHLGELVFGEEALLAEVNPLIIIPNGSLIAADAKVIIDNNALARHPVFGHNDVLGHSKLELQAKGAGLSYVELEGNVAIIGNGAGLVMATLDAVDEYGGKPANFCDVGGGASAEMVNQAIDIVLQKSSVTVLFINVFGGITHCDEVANGIVHAIRSKNVQVPVVIRMVGTNEDEAHNILRAEGFDVQKSFEEAAQKAAALST